MVPTWPRVIHATTAILSVTIILSMFDPGDPPAIAILFTGLTLVSILCLPAVWQLTGYWGQLLRRFGMCATRPELLSNRERGLETVSAGSGGSTSDFVSLAACSRGIYFWQSPLLIWRSGFLVPWEDVRCSTESRWRELIGQPVVFQFDDPEVDLVCYPERLYNDTFVSALVDRGLLPEEARRRKPLSW